LTPVFLTVEEALEIHADQLERYGGSPGLRDLGLLESALAMPTATFGGVLLHPTLAEMAAAYLFHITANHPFVDGNKRVGLMAALVFLGLNGLRLGAGSTALVELCLGVAEGKLSKAVVAVFIARHTRPTRRR